MDSILSASKLDNRLRKAPIAKWGLSHKPDIEIFANLKKM